SSANMLDRKVHIGLYNSLGKKVYYKNKTAKKNMALNIPAELPSGMYMLKVVYDNGSITKKMIKE
ncbi:MAG: T9SS type A sorting domain-containing protein, partial [Flavobacteriales bacterium]